MLFFCRPNPRLFSEKREYSFSVGGDNFFSVTVFARISDSFGTREELFSAESESVLAVGAESCHRPFGSTLSDFPKVLAEERLFRECLVCCLGFLVVNPSDFPKDSEKKALFRELLCCFSSFESFSLIFSKQQKIPPQQRSIAVMGDVYLHSLCRNSS